MKNRTLLLIIVVYFVVINSLLFWPSTNMPSAPSIPYFDKLVHFGIYFIFQAIVMAYLHRRTNKMLPAVLTALLLIGHGCLVEYIQPSFNRGFDTGDMVADATGVLAALVLVPPIINFFGKRGDGPTPQR